MSATWPRRGEPARGEAGMALVMVLLAILIVSGIVAVLFTWSNNTLRQTDREANWELALQEADGSVNAVVGEVLEALAYTNGADLPVHVDTPEEERAWAVAQLEAAIAAGPGTANLRSVPGGWAYGIRPARSGQALGVVYGVSRVGGGARAVTRVVRASIDDDQFAPQMAILTEGDLLISGGSDVDGTSGNVHSNSDMELSGGGDSEGAYTSSGSYAGSGGIECDVDGDGVGGDPCEDPSQGGRDPIEIFSFSARDFYPQRTSHAGNWYSLSEPRDPAAYNGTWFDLCPDGFVHAPADAGGAPCDDVANRIADANGSAYREWKFNGGEWERTGDTFAGDVVYVHHANVSSGGLGGSSDYLATTILVAADLDGGDPAGDLTGSIAISGGAYLDPVLGGVLIVADRDYKSSGGMSTQNDSFIGLGEELEFSGGQGFHGVLMAQGLDRYGAGADASPIERSKGNKLTGSAVIRYDGGMTLPLGDGLRIAYWDEL